MLSPKKMEMEKKRIISKCRKCDGRGCTVCHNYCAFVDKMAFACIPVDYWFRYMKDWYGNRESGDKISSFISDIDKMFDDGGVLCLVGHRGVGKTMASCCILKQALLSGYSAHYASLVDVVGYLTSYEAVRYRSLLRMTDFVVIDEVDQRFFETENSRKLYGNHFENILRIRVQNKLPMIMCTNSEDADQIFIGEFRESISSLRSQFFTMVPMIGKDVRKNVSRS
jgi:DNA replication protein DnaC